MFSFIDPSMLSLSSIVQCTFRVVQLCKYSLNRSPFELTSCRSCHVFSYSFALFLLLKRVKCPPEFLSSRGIDFAERRTTAERRITLRSRAFNLLLLSRTWSRVLISFPFPFKRLPRRLSRGNAWARSLSLETMYHRKRIIMTEGEIKRRYKIC